MEFIDQLFIAALMLVIIHCTDLSLIDGHWSRDPVVVYRCTMTEDVHYRHVIYPMCRMPHIHDGRRPLPSRDLSDMQDASYPSMTTVSHLTILDNATRRQRDLVS